MKARASRVQGRGRRASQPGLDVAQVSQVVYVAVQEAISDQLRMTRPQLAGDGRGLELWRMLIREHDAPGAALGTTRVPETMGLPGPL